MMISKRLTIGKEKLPPKNCESKYEKLDDREPDEGLAQSVTQSDQGDFLCIKKELLVLNSIRAHVTELVKVAIKSTNLVPAVIPGGTTKYQFSSATGHQREPGI